MTRLLRGTLPSDAVPTYGRSLPHLGAAVPIIVVTAYRARYSESELLSAGGSKFVTKRGLLGTQPGARFIPPRAHAVAAMKRVWARAAGSPAPAP